MCLYATNLKFIRNIVPRCSWQVCGVCLAVCMFWGCLYDPHICTPHTSVHPFIHLYTPLYVCSPPYIPYMSPYICTPHTSVCSPYFCTYPNTSVHPLTSECPIHLFAPLYGCSPIHPLYAHTPPYICTSPHTSVHPHTPVYPPVCLFTPYIPYRSPYIFTPQYICMLLILLYIPHYICTPLHMYAPYVCMSLAYLYTLYILPYVCMPYTSVPNICFYHCSRKTCRLYVRKNLYRNLDFCLAAK